MVERSVDVAGNGLNEGEIQSDGRSHLLFFLLSRRVERYFGSLTRNRQRERKRRRRRRGLTW